MTRTPYPIPFLALALASCSAPAPIIPSSENLAALRGRPLTITHYTSKPDFVAMTAGTAAFGIIGALAQIAEGNDLIEKNNVPDPADTISARLAAAYQARYDADRPSTTTELASYSSAALPATVGHDGIILDVKTTRWMFGYFPLDWGHYHVDYAASARLVDATTRKEIARSSCMLKSSDAPDQKPSYDDLTADHAAGLKARLDDMAARCAAAFAHDLLGTEGAGPLPGVAGPTNAHAPATAQR
jgi:hypothetical protein